MASQGKQVVDKYFKEYFEKENHLPRKDRHRLVIGSDGNLAIVQLNRLKGYATKLSRSGLGRALCLGKIFTVFGVPDANIRRVLIECLKLGVDKEKVQKLMDHFNHYHPKCPVTWKDLC